MLSPILANGVMWQFCRNLEIVCKGFPPLFPVFHKDLRPCHCPASGSWISSLDLHGVLIPVLPVVNILDVMAKLFNFFPRVFL